MIDPQLLRLLIPSVAIAWTVGCCTVSLLVNCGLLDVPMGEALKISTVSGLIGLLSVAPFSSPIARAIGGRPFQAAIESEAGLIVAFSAGMVIRVLGTVALFLACRYQLGSMPETLATLVLGWYLYLTLVEISVVVTRSSKFVKPAADSSSSSVTSSSESLS